MNRDILWGNNRLFSTEGIDLYSDSMASRPGRVLALLAGAGIAVWWGRLMAHSKKPPPEGRWREVPRDSFS